MLWRAQLQALVICQTYLQFLDWSIFVGPICISDSGEPITVADITLQQAEKWGMKNGLENHLGRTLLS